jgi:UDP-glucose 4-epimerase
MVVPRFVEAALKGAPLVVYGNGQQTRCFGHISDITAAILMLDNSAGAVGVPVNVGVNKEISILDLARTVIAQTNSSSSIEFLDYESAYPAGYEDMERRVPDISLLREITGWKPEYSIDKIISDISLYLSGITSS